MKYEITVVREVDSGSHCLFIKTNGLLYRWWFFREDEKIIKKKLSSNYINWYLTNEDQRENSGLPISNVSVIYNYIVENEV